MAMWKFLCVSTVVLVLCSLELDAFIIECEGESTTKTVHLSKTGLAYASFCVNMYPPPSSYAGIPYDDGSCFAHHVCAGHYFWWWEPTKEDRDIYTIHVQIRNLPKQGGGKFPMTIFNNLYLGSLNLTVTVSDKVQEDTEDPEPTHVTPRIEECADAEAKSAASSSKKCPSGWLPFGDGLCVLSELGHPLNYPQAQESCAIFGASLVKVEKVEDQWVRRRRAIEESIDEDEDEDEDKRDDDEDWDEYEDEDDFYDADDEEEAELEDVEKDGREISDADESEVAEDDKDGKKADEDDDGNLREDGGEDDEYREKQRDDEEDKLGKEAEERVIVAKDSGEDDKYGDKEKDDKKVETTRKKDDKEDFDEGIAGEDGQGEIEDLEDAEKEKNQDGDKKDGRGMDTIIQGEGLQRGDQYKIDQCLNARLHSLSGSERVWVMDDQDESSCLGYNSDTKIVQEERSCSYLYNKFTCIFDTRQYRKPTITKFQLQLHYSEGEHKNVSLNVKNAGVQYHEVKDGMTSATISCEADGWPKPEVLIVEEAVAAQPQSLHASPYQHNISQEEGLFLGKYGCIASNNFGDQVKIGNLQLWRYERPPRVRLVVSGVMIMLLIIIVIVGLVILNRYRVFRSWGKCHSAICSCNCFPCHRRRPTGARRVPTDIFPPSQDYVYGDAWVDDVPLYIRQARVRTTSNSEPVYKKCTEEQ
ncbi:hypothetical protein RRG08_037896 [Elysia crispata]|uniref:C-type lectin domain-containing protein n=1 Tax=Elysia crispata TaxID=231223 RepID=A0AAE0ZKQ9_9GAST|nr:hypothetical protein RRG08_037896 [Elysia crispata]